MRDCALQLNVIIVFYSDLSFVFSSVLIFIEKWTSYPSNRVIIKTGFVRVGASLDMASALLVMVT